MGSTAGEVEFEIGTTYLAGPAGPSSRWHVELDNALIDIQ